MAPDKAPAFQFYPKDFLTDEKVVLMSNTEVGIYMRLLCFCWLEGTLPLETDSLARMARVPLKQFTKLWERSVVRTCFQVDGDGRLRHKRLEEEREKQELFKRRQSDRAQAGADARWHKHEVSNAQAMLKHPQSIASGHAQAMPGDASSSSSSSSSSSPKEEEKKEISAETLPRSPPLLSFPTIGLRPEWPLTEAQLTEWATLYPGLDVLGEARQALAWVRANGPKTAKGMPAFLVNWFNRSVKAGGARRGTEGLVGKQTARMMHAVANIKREALP